MATSPNSSNLADECRRLAERAATASRKLAVAHGDAKNTFLLEAARRLRAEQARILQANAADVAAAPDFGLTAAQVDRLRLDEARIESIAAGLEAVAALPDPIGEIIEGTVRPNGLEIAKVRVPLGVIFFVYESRPNVTADAAAICVKSGNAVILRGGKEAANSSAAIVEVLWDALESAGLPRDAALWVERREREAVSEFLRLSESIDLAIPRGGYALIERVARDATMPVIKHFSGNCHVYVDADAGLEMAERIVINAKCQRPGVCNACESLLVHQAIADSFLPQIGRALGDAGVEIRGDEAFCRLIPHARPASDEDYATEFLDLILSARVVPSLDEAIAHINRFGSKHSDAIVTNSLAAAREFAAGVDTAATFINASTRFHDGGEFGLGAEIGISTDKFHARGPCGLKELTSYKYVVHGSGQVR